VDRFKLCFNIASPEVQKVSSFAPVYCLIMRQLYGTCKQSRIKIWPKHAVYIGRYFLCFAGQRLFWSSLYSHSFYMSILTHDFVLYFLQWRVRDSSVGIATRYGLDGPGFESRWGRDFPHPARPTLGPTQPHIQWVPGLSRG
jgi:hypothetical protein